MPDGRLEFDTQIDQSGFEKGLEDLREACAAADIRIPVETMIDSEGVEQQVNQIVDKIEASSPTVLIKSEIDESGYSADKAAIEKDASAGIKNDIQIDTSVDDSGLKRDIKNLDNTAARELSALNEPIKDGEIRLDTRVVSNGFGNVVKGVLSADLLREGAQKLGDLAVKSIQLASDLEEVQNVVDTTFGDGADTINDFSKNAISAYGLSELQAKRYSSTLGAMTKSMGLTDDAMLEMSQSLTGLVGDMASFYNLDHDTAFDKIRAGISGETEPLKQLGINMSVANLEAYALSKGLQKAYEDMSEAEKVQLRYGYIMAQTTDAQGDFVRTQDGYANQVRLLQNNLETLGASVGSVLLPKLTSAVSWLNSLFAGPGETNATQTAINGAVASLSTIKSDLLDLKNNYATTSLTIDVTYNRAQDLINDLQTLQNLPTTTVGVTKQMQDITAALVGMYPALEEYVGDDGIFKKEADSVQELVKHMRDLAKEQAYQALVAGMQTTYTQALVNYELLGAEYERALANAQKMQTQIDALNKIDTVRAATQERYAGYSMNIEKNPQHYQEIIDAINGYVSAFGGLENIDSERINRLGVDLGGLFDGAQLKKLNELNAEKRIGDLVNLLGLISDADLSEKDIRGQYENAQTAIETAQNALKTEADSLLLAAEELETAEKLYNEKFGDGATDVIDYVAEAQAAVEEQSAKIEENLSNGINEGVLTGTQNALVNLNAPQTLQKYASAGSAAGSAYGKAYKSAAEQYMRNIQVGGGVASSTFKYDGSHATGLDYVPFDGYIAKLHVGESVLNASDARAWRAGESKGGGGVTPAQLTAAMEPVVDAIRHIRIALDIDGEQFASNQAVNNRNALSDRARMIARGYGK